MLLPDNSYPKLCIFYWGGVILDEFTDADSIEVTKLFEILRKKHNISLFSFELGMDWLYLINLIIVDEKGMAKKCI